MKRYEIMNWLNNREGHELRSEIQWNKGHDYDNEKEFEKQLNVERIRQELRESRDFGWLLEYNWEQDENTSGNISFDQDTIIYRGEISTMDWETNVLTSKDVEYKFHISYFDFSEIEYWKYDFQSDEEQLTYECEYTFHLKALNHADDALYQYNDGGRKDAGYKGVAGDCGARSMAIALEIPYKQAYDQIALANKNDPRSGKKSARNGVYRDTFTEILKTHGWSWVKAPKIAGRKARASDLPKGRYIARMAKHYAAVVDGVVQDSWDSSHKMVYGYWAQDPQNK